ncbi:putative MFS-type transporter YbfB [Rhizobium sp. BK418]|nr:putative MFS-type transporter YbfB [Rhizobium sp. BK418]
MQRTDHFAGVAAALVLVVGMGFGRFAFTGLYPLMVADGQISLTGGSYAASANYTGYLAGALLTAALSGISSRRLCAFSMLATVVSLVLLVPPLPEWLIIVIRGFSGAASAIAMVAASRWLIHDRRQHSAAPALFSGVGMGILLSAELIVTGRAGRLSSASIWMAMASASLAAAGVAIKMQALADARRAISERADVEVGEHISTLAATRLILVYGFAGFGYIITATYLPLLVKEALSNADPVHVWALFGLGAVPSCFVWHFVHLRWGTNRAMLSNLMLQAVGVILPLLHIPAAYLISAVFVGGTFMGTVTIALPAARRIAHRVRFNVIAIMTASYGVGQILGPLVASYTRSVTGSFDASLAIAGAVLAGGALLCISRQTA